MPLDFPASPTVGQTYSFQGKSWQWNGTGWAISTAASLTPAAVPGYLSGLILANDTTTPATVLDIAVGGAASDDATPNMMALTTAITKNCNAAWAVGSGNGALDSGSALAASAWYHVFLIMRTDTGAVDVLISTSATAPMLPANYTKKRRIGAILTDASSHILPFVQVGDDFLWVNPINSYTNVSITTTPLTFTAAVPLGVKVIAKLSIQTNFGVAGYTYWYSPDTGAALNNVTIWNFAGAYNGAQLSIRTDTNRGIVGVANGSYTGVWFGTLGWFDNRGK